MIRGLSKAECKGKNNINQLADKLSELGIDKKPLNRQGNLRFKKSTMAKLQKLSLKNTYQKKMRKINPLMHVKFADLNMSEI